MTQRFKVTLLIMTVLICNPSKIRGEEGVSAYDFLNIPSSSFVMGSGGVNISSLHSDINLADQNPSLIGPENNMQLNVGYMLYFGVSNFAGARFAMATGEHGAWGAGVRYLNYGSFQGYDPEGFETGDFSVQDIIVEATYSHDITYSLRGGINVKFVYSGYEKYTALALAADLGLSYYDEFHDFSLGFVLKNMGGQIKRFEDKYDRLPFDIQIGITKGLSEQFSFSITADNLVRWKIPYYYHTNNEEGVMKSGGFLKNFFRHIVLGIEYDPIRSLYLTMGYNYKTMTDMDSYRRSLLSGFSIGAGFNIKAWSIGASYALPQRGASTLMVNLGIDINEFL
ncbi:MAG: type IX secretion system protein PorQ [Muribaculaceae bacterium]|nr:type IX secretion system protein PorQ [Muribaculaceae bacterium]